MHICVRNDVSTRQNWKDKTNKAGVSFIISSSIYITCYDTYCGPQNGCCS